MGVIMKVYNKLVRDKIPEIIEADGKVCRTHILSNEDYIVALELISLFPLKDIRICAGVQIQTGLVFFYSTLPHFYKTLTYTTLQRMDFPDRIRVIIDLDK